jgi:5'-nucleotidase
MRHSLHQTLAALVLVTALAAPSRAQTQNPVELRILAINDFHGYLRPPPGGIRIADPADKTRKIVVPAGGSERMATLVRQLREGHKNTVFVAAGRGSCRSPRVSATHGTAPGRMASA